MQDELPEPKESSLLDRMDALLTKHRTHPHAEPELEIPTLTEVVIDLDNPDDIPVLQDLAPEYTAAAAFPEVDQDADIPILHEALPDSLTDVKAFGTPSTPQKNEADLVIELEGGHVRVPEVELVELPSSEFEIVIEDEPLPTALAAPAADFVLELPKEHPDQELHLTEPGPDPYLIDLLPLPDVEESIEVTLPPAEVESFSFVPTPSAPQAPVAAPPQQPIELPAPVLAVPVVEASPLPSELDDGILAAELDTAVLLTDRARALASEMWSDVEKTLNAKVESAVRQHFSLKLASLYREALDQALRAALVEVRQDLRSTLEQIVAEQLSMRDQERR